MIFRKISSFFLFHCLKKKQKTTLLCVTRWRAQPQECAIVQGTYLTQSCGINFHGDIWNKRFRATSDNSYWSNVHSNFCDERILERYTFNDLLLRANRGSSFLCYIGVLCYILHVYLTLMIGLRAMPLPVSVYRYKAW